jgi:hypothetical protein
MVFASPPTARRRLVLHARERRKTRCVISAFAQNRFMQHGDRCGWVLKQPARLRPFGIRARRTVLLLLLLMGKGIRTMCRNSVAVRMGRRGKLVRKAACAGIERTGVGKRRSLQDGAFLRLALHTVTPTPPPWYAPVVGRHMYCSLHVFWPVFHACCFLLFLCCVLLARPSSCLS